LHRTAWPHPIQHSAFVCAERGQSHDLQVDDVQAAADGVLFGDEELEAAPERRASDDR
jgi:hypothetical protein